MVSQICRGQLNSALGNDRPVQCLIVRHAKALMCTEATAVGVERLARNISWVAMKPR